MYKVGMETNFSLTVSTNEESVRLRHKWKHFCFCWHRLGCSWLWLAETFLQKKRWYFVCEVTTRLLDMYHHHETTYSLFFGPYKECLKRKSTFCIAGIRNNFIHFLPMYGRRHTFVVTKTFRDSRHFQKNLAWFLSFFEKINLVANLRKKNEIVCSSKEKFPTWQVDVQSGHW